LVDRRAEATAKDITYEGCLDSDRKGYLSSNKDTPKLTTHKLSAAETISYNCTVAYISIKDVNLCKSYKYREEKECYQSVTSFGY